MEPFPSLPPVVPATAHGGIDRGLIDAYLSSVRTDLLTLLSHLQQCADLVTTASGAETAEGDRARPLYELSERLAAMLGTDDVIGDALLELWGLVANLERELRERREDTREPR